MNEDKTDASDGFESMFTEELPICIDDIPVLISTVTCIFIICSIISGLTFFRL